MNAITTNQAQSALILLSVIATTLERGEPYTVSPADLPWIMVTLRLMPEMPLADERDNTPPRARGGE